MHDIVSVEAAATLPPQLDTPSLDLAEYYLRLDHIGKLTIRINRIIGHNLDYIHRKRVHGKKVCLCLGISRQGLFAHSLDFDECEEGETIALPYGGVMRITRVDSVHKFVTLTFAAK